MMFSSVYGACLWNETWAGATSAKVNVVANVIGVGVSSPETILSVRRAVYAIPVDLVSVFVGIANSS